MAKSMAPNSTAHRPYRNGTPFSEWVTPAASTLRKLSSAAVTWDKAAGFFDAERVAALSSRRNASSLSPTSDEAASGRTLLKYSGTALITQALAAFLSVPRQQARVAKKSA